MFSKLKSLNNLSVEEINHYLLNIRLKDNKEILEKKASTPQEEKMISLCKAMTLSYGSTHSAHSKQRGLFNDLYHREGILSGMNDLFSLMLLNLQKEIVSQIPLADHEESQDFFPIHDYQLLKELLGIQFNTYFEDKEYSVRMGEKSIPLVKAKVYIPSEYKKMKDNDRIMEANKEVFRKEDRDKQLKFLRAKIGTLAQFPNKYSQLEIIASQSNADFYKLFERVSEKILKTESYAPSELKSAAAIKKETFARIRDFRGNPEKVSQLKLFKSLIDAINIDLEIEPNELKNNQVMDLPR